MRKLQSFSIRAEAEMACELLKAAGISCVIQSDDCGGLRPNIAFATGGSMVYVDEKDYLKALKLIAPAPKAKKKKKRT